MLKRVDKDKPRIRKEYLCESKIHFNVGYPTRQRIDVGTIRERLKIDGGNYVYSPNSQAILRYAINLRDPSGVVDPAASSVKLTIAYSAWDSGTGSWVAQTPYTIDLYYNCNDDHTVEAYSRCGQIAGNTKMCVESCQIQINLRGSQYSLFTQTFT